MGLVQYGVPIRSMNNVLGKDLVSVYEIIFWSPLRLDWCSSHRVLELQRGMWRKSVVAITPQTYC